MSKFKNVKKCQNLISHISLLFSAAGENFENFRGQEAIFLRKKSIFRVPKRVNHSGRILYQDWVLKFHTGRDTAGLILKILKTEKKGRISERILKNPV